MFWAVKTLKKNNVNIKLFTFLFFKAVRNRKVRTPS